MWRKTLTLFIIFETLQTTECKWGDSPWLTWLQADIEFSNFDFNYVNSSKLWHKIIFFSINLPCSIGWRFILVVKGLTNKSKNLDFIPST